MFQAAVGQWGMKPSEFWQLHPCEFWWIAEAKSPRPNYGGLTENEIEECWQEVQAWRRANGRIGQG
jgi:hypothetical protein